jgi:Ca2+/H+ antiporter, TMEM165/GDT1 family
MTTLLTALIVVFVAELGDKTQLVAAGFGARHRLAPVLFGIAIAYLGATLVSIVVGGLLGAALPVRAISIVGGLLFIALAIKTFVSGDNDAEEDGQSAAGAKNRSVIVTVAATTFIAELGDKTMLATATLAAKGSPVLVGIGAYLGIVASGALGVIVGRAAGARLPARTLRIASSLAFAVAGIGLLISAING